MRESEIVDIFGPLFDELSSWRRSGGSAMTLLERE
jgi:hypothetical protein